MSYGILSVGILSCGILSGYHFYHGESTKERETYNAGQGNIMSAGWPAEDKVTGVIINPASQ